MRVLKLVSVFILLTSLQATAQSNDKRERVEKYIKQYKLMAMEEQKRVGIPAAVTLAQGIHETNAGASELATNANNHFGIKCKKEWTGDTYTYTDDRPNECFRKYGNDVESYKDHSDYLKTSKRYEQLFTLSMTDYAGWAYGLKRCGYATNPKYAQVLIKTIEDNHLQDYTYAALGKDYDPLKEAEKAVVMGQRNATREVVPEQDAPRDVASSTKPEDKKAKMVVSDGNNRYSVIKNSEKPKYGQLVIVNGVKAFYAKKDASLLDEAMKHNMRYAKLLELNDLPDAPLEADMFIYLEKKNIKGNTTYHVAKPGETMLQIAQMEGIQIKTLRQYNKIKENEEPASGSLLQLQEVADQKPEVIVKRKEKESDEMAFSGSGSRAVPPGTTRMKAGYISKEEIESSKNDEPVKRSKREVTANTEQPKTDIIQASYKTEEKPVVADPAPPAKAEEKVAIAAAKKEAAPDVEKKVIASKEEEVQNGAIDNAETTTKSNSDTDPINPAAAPIEEKNKEEDKIVLSKPKVEEIKEPVAPAAEPTPTPEQPGVNIADTKTVEEEKAEVKKEEEEPKDEFARLKAKLDKAVYASEKSAASKKTEKKEEVKSEVVVEKKMPVAEKKVEAKPQATDNKPGYYTVKKGDSGFAIAKKHHITMTQLKEWNKLDFGEIKVGQKLRVK